MQKTLILTLLVVSALSSGQWTKQDLSTVQNDARIGEVEKLARAKLQNKANAEPKLVGLETQVVAGVNYKFTYENYDRLCHVTVWSKPWENVSEVTNVKCDQPPHQTGFDKDAYKQHHNKDKKKEQNFGGWKNIDAKGLIGTDELKADLYGKAQAHVATTYGINEELTKKSIETKLVAGSLYRVSVESQDGTVYQVTYLSQPWVDNGVYKVVDTKVLAKEEHNEMVGGWQQVNANLSEEFTSEVVAEAKQYIYGVTGYNGIIQYQSMSQKVVNGVVYKVDFSGMDGQSFSVEVLSQPWNSEKQFSVINFNVVKGE